VPQGLFVAVPLGDEHFDSLRHVLSSRRRVRMRSRAIAGLLVLTLLLLLLLLVTSNLSFDLLDSGAL
jgi:hypothetical protein